MKNANLKSHSARYVDEGPFDGKPVVLIHAFPLSHRMWASQIRALSSKYRVIAYDVRGFGGSTSGSEAPTMDGLTDDLFELLDFLKIEHAALIGLSMGGYIALRAKERRPERIRALVLADTRTEPDSEEGRMKRFQTCEKLEKGDISARREFAEGFLSGALAKSTHTTQPRLIDDLRREILSNSVSGICGALRAMAGRTDTSGALTTNPLPTLILVGENDGITPVESAKQMQKKHGNAKLHVLSGAGHLSNLESPEKFNERLLSFLSEIE